MMMIKNVFFCVAKYKVDIPDGQFYIILLGTDHLKSLFALVRCATGTDSNIDLLQLANRMSGLTEVAAILVMHPEWDRNPCRLNLPAITADDRLSKKINHINATSWHGNVKVNNVNLQAC